MRIDLDKHDPCIFTATPWVSPSWRSDYNWRSAIERINSRLDNSFNFETHYIRGLAKMKTCVGLALVVMMALAPRQVRAGRVEQMRSPERGQSGCPAGLSRSVFFPELECK